MAYSKSYVNFSCSLQDLVNIASSSPLDWQFKDGQLVQKKKFLIEKIYLLVKDIFLYFIFFISDGQIRLDPRPARREHIDRIVQALWQKVDTVNREWQVLENHINTEPHAHLNNLMLLNRLVFWDDFWPVEPKATRYPIIISDIKVLSTYFSNKILHMVGHSFQGSLSLEISEPLKEVAIISGYLQELGNLEEPYRQRLSFTYLGKHQPNHEVFLWIETKYPALLDGIVDTNPVFHIKSAFNWSKSLFLEKNIEVDLNKAFERQIKRYEILGEFINLENERLEQDPVRVAFKARLQKKENPQPELMEEQPYA